MSQYNPTESRDPVSEDSRALISWLAMMIGLFSKETRKPRLEPMQVYSMARRLLLPPGAKILQSAHLINVNEYLSAPFPQMGIVLGAVQGLEMKLLDLSEAMQRNVNSRLKCTSAGMWWYKDEPLPIHEVTLDMHEYAHWAVQHAFALSINPRHAGEEKSAQAIGEAYGTRYVPTLTDHGLAMEIDGKRAEPKIGHAPVLPIQNETTKAEFGRQYYKMYKGKSGAKNWDQEAHFRLQQLHNIHAKCWIHQGWE